MIMPRSIIQWWLSLLLSAMVLVAAGGEIAVDEGGGIGGTGHSDWETGGMGGTGVQPDDGDSGGIGGTGLVGVITGFGSILVNGQHVEYDPYLPVSDFVGGQRAASQLEIGHLVEIIARADAQGNLHAERIQLRHALAGDLTRQGEGWSLMGQPLGLDQASGLDVGSLQTGQRVAASGFWEGERLRVTRLETWYSSSDLVAGPLSADHRIGRIRLSGSLPDVRSGADELDQDLLVAIGRGGPDGFTIRQASAHPRIPPVESVSRWLIERPASNGPGAGRLIELRRDNGAWRPVGEQPMRGLDLGQPRRDARPLGESMPLPAGQRAAGSPGGDRPRVQGQGLLGFPEPGRPDRGQGEGAPAVGSMRLDPLGAGQPGSNRRDAGSPSSPFGNDPAQGFRDSMERQRNQSISAPRPPGSATGPSSGPFAGPSSSSPMARPPSSGLRPGSAPRPPPRGKPR